MVGRGKLTSLIGALALAGCAILDRGEELDRQRLLVQAGFRAQPANLDAMPPRVLVKQERDGHVVYAYADPEYCQCLYLGGPSEYATYQTLSREEEEARELPEKMKSEEYGPMGR